MEGQTLAALTFIYYLTGLRRPHSVHLFTSSLLLRTGLILSHWLEKKKKKYIEDLVGERVGTMEEGDEDDKNKAEDVSLKSHSVR